MTDNVNHPAHYQLRNGGEAIDLVTGALTPEGEKGWYLGNVLKYVVRARKKNGLEDYLKARFYLDRLIQLESKEPGC